MATEVSLTGYRLAKYVTRAAKNFDRQKDGHEKIELEKEWPAILSAMPYFFRGDNDDFQILCRQLRFFLKSSGRWEELLWIYQNAEKKAEDTSDYYSAGWRAYDIGLIYSYREQPRDVIEAAGRVKTHWQKLDTDKMSGEFPLIGYLYGIGHLIEGNYAVAVKFFEDSAEKLKEARAEDEKIADVLNALGEAQMEFWDLSFAEENLTEALRIAEAIEDQERVLIFSGNLAGLALLQRDWAKAETMALDALKLAEELNQEVEVAQNNYRIARALMMQDNPNPSLASSYALKSVNVYTRLRHKNLSDAVTILMRAREDSLKKSVNN